MRALVRRHWLKLLAVGWLVVGGWGIWDAVPVRPRVTLASSQQSHLPLAFRPKGDIVATAPDHMVDEACIGPIVLWDTKSGMQIWRFEIGDGSFSSRDVRFSKDGKCIALRLGGSLKVWNVQNGEDLSSTVKGGAGFWDDMFPPAGGPVATYYEDSLDRVKIVDVATAREQATIHLPEYLPDTEDGYYILDITTCPGRDVHALTMGRPTSLDVLHCCIHTGSDRHSLVVLPGFNPDFSPDGRFLAIEREFWKEPTWTQRLMAWLAPSRFAADDVPTHTVTLYDAITARPVAQLPVKETLPGWRQFQFGPDGATLATRGASGAIELWDLPPKKPHGLILALWALWALPALSIACWRRVRRRRRGVAVGEAVA